MRFLSTLVSSALIASVVVARPVELPKRDPCEDSGATSTTTTASGSQATKGNNLSTSSGIVADGLTLAQIDALTPQFGFTSGVNPDGTGNCDGAVLGSNGKPILIPCDCPPPRDLFIKDLAANIAAGFAVNNTAVKLSFPTDNSTNSILARFNAASDTLQNLVGPGKGCPIVSTTWQAQTKAIQDGTAPPPPPPPPAPPATNIVLTATSTLTASSSTATQVDNASDPCGQFNANPPASSPASSSSASTSSKTTSSSSAAATTSSSSSSSPPPTVTGAAGLSLAQIDALTPQFGHASGVNPDGTGNCDGAVNGSNGKPILVPCDCPPPRDLFIQDLAANIAAGFAVNNTVVKLSFPTDNSTNSILARFNAASDTLQNLDGPGKGCPIVSTTWQAQSKAIQDGTAPPAVSAASSSTVSTSASSSSSVSSSTPASSSSPASASSSASFSSQATSTPASSASAPAATSTNAASLSLSQLDALTPQFGHASGVNPDGHGNCDGAVNGSDGKPIQVPCACPPARDSFLQSLQADIDAGFAVHNPSVKVSFPTDDSKSSQITRIQAAIVALQNLNGEGQGCPASSTTFSAQLKALTG